MQITGFVISQHYKTSRFNKIFVYWSHGPIILGLTLRSLMPHSNPIQPNKCSPRECPTEVSSPMAQTHSQIIKKSFRVLKPEQREVSETLNHSWLLPHFSTISNQKTSADSADIQRYAQPQEFSEFAEKQQPILRWREWLDRSWYDEPICGL